MSYRAAGLTPIQYESAGRRRDGGISGEGSVHLRRALIELGIGLWQRDPASRAYAHTLRERGKPGGVIACALAYRANKIAFVMVRHLSGSAHDQTAPRRGAIQHPQPPA
jgi:transposase